MKLPSSLVAVIVYFSIGTLTLGGCHSAPSAPTVTSQPSNSSDWQAENHLPFAMFNRSNSCCSATGKEVAAASGGENSSKIALEIYAQGGNAIDAAVAAGFALVVERVYSVGLAGGGFLTLHLAKGKTPGDYFVDFRESAPRHATANMFIDAQGKVNSQASQVGGLASGVPGLVAGLYDMHKKWGKLAWKKVVEPAAKLAAEGIIITPNLTERLILKKDTVAKDPYLAKLLFDADKQPLKTGDRLIQTDLAKTLRAIAKSGKKAFYSGPIAKKMIDTVKKRGGIMDLEDLKRYEVKFREPLISKFKNYILVSAPPPSSGGVVTTETLSILDGFDLKKESQNPALYSNLLAETLKRAYADRSVNVGDPDYFKNDYAKLLTPEYIEAARKSIQPGKVTPGKDLKPGEFVRPRTTGTTNFTSIDADGNAVAMTISGNGYFGSYVGIPGTGILMNNTMDDFTLKVGEANMWGIIAGQGNGIVPGKRPLSSMTPTVILTADSKTPVLAVSGAGGSKIISTVIQIILGDLFLFDGDLKRAVFAPRIHHQWLPDKLEVEAGYSATTQDQLKKMGYELDNPARPPVVSAAAQDPVTHQLTAVIDARDQGGAEAK